MMKIRNIAVVLSIFAFAGCSTFNGSEGQWAKSSPRQYSKQLEVDANPVSYTLSTKPTFVKTSIADNQVTLGFNLTLNTMSGQYNGSSVGWAEVIAQSHEDENGVFHYSEFNIDKIHFNDMEPFVYANIWPVAKHDWELHLQESK